MPAAGGAKRVKNTRIERAFIIGSEAWPLDDTNRPPGVDPTHTKGWKVYVRAPDGADGGPSLSSWLKKVSFKIFHTYENPIRTCENPPFEIQETGWGGFVVDVKLFFVPEASERPQARQHFLQLEPFGTEEQQARQIEDKLVRSEVLDYIEFNEPTEALFDMLTDEAQFAGPKKGKGKGKGPGKANAKGLMGNGAADAGPRTVELPESSTPSNPYSKETEKQLIELLSKAQKQVTEMIDDERKRERAAFEKLQELKTAKAL